MRTIIRFAFIAIVLTVGWMTWPFLLSASKQAERQHQELFKTASKRDWQSVRELMADNFEDQWGSKRDEAVELAKELCSGFLVLEIKWETVEASANDNIVKVRGNARMEGNGMGVSQMVMNKVNQLKEPWVFTWRKDGWKPSDWKLVSVTNKELEGVGLPSDL